MVFISEAKHFRRIIDGARRLQLVRPKRLRNPIPRSAVIAVSSYLEHLLLPATKRLPLPSAARAYLNLAIVARVAFASFLRVGEFIYSPKD